MMPTPSEIALMRWARRANNRNWDRPPGRIAGTNPPEAGAPMRTLKPPDRRTIMASLLALSLAGPAFADSGRSRDFVAEIYRVAGGPSGDGSAEAVFADEANRKRFLSLRIARRDRRHGPAHAQRRRSQSTSIRSVAATIRTSMICGSRLNASRPRAPL
jgi:hypothetical protein